MLTKRFFGTFFHKFAHVLHSAAAAGKEKLLKRRIPLLPLLSEKIKSEN